MMKLSIKPCGADPGLEIDNEKVKNDSIFDTSKKKSSEFLHSITKIKSRGYRSKRYFPLTQLTATTSTYVNANGKLDFRFGKKENVSVEGIAMGRRLHWDVSPDISDLNIGQIRRLEKKYTFCDPCFLSLFTLKKHRSQNL